MHGKKESYVNNAPVRVAYSWERSIMRVCAGGYLYERGGGPASFLLYGSGERNWDARQKREKEVAEWEKLQ